MERIKAVFISGLVATFIVGAMLLMNNAIHRLPRLGIGRSLATILGLHDNLFAGWLIFIVLGIFVFSAVFLWCAPRIPVKAYAVKGLIFGAALWLLMMLVFEPLSGQGVFASHLGNIAAVLTLVLNLIYGVILSVTYRWMLGSQPNVSTVKA
jgi:hypothetical protein